MGRLTAVLDDGTTFSKYTYDENGNRTSYWGVMSNNQTITAGYDAQDKILRYGDKYYTYTANGARKTKYEDGVGTTTYTWDGVGNLIKVELPNSDEIEYTVDAYNNRVCKKKNGVIVQKFLYAGGKKPVAEVDENNNIVSTFTYATNRNVPDYMLKISNNTKYRIISDNTGSPRLVVNVTTGAVVQKIDYDEFGNILEDTNPGFQPFGFRGGIHDHDTNLIHGSEYDPEIGEDIDPTPTPKPTPTPIPTPSPTPSPLPEPYPTPPIFVDPWSYPELLPPPPNFKSFRADPHVWWAGCCCCILGSQIGSVPANGANWICEITQGITSLISHGRWYQKPGTAGGFDRNDILRVKGFCKEFKIWEEETDKMIEYYRGLDDYYLCW